MRDWVINQRRSRNFTQEELANRTGLTRQMISAIERGERRPSPEVAQRIAAVLGFDWTLFFELPTDTDKSA